MFITRNSIIAFSLFVCSFSTLEAQVCELVSLGQDYSSQKFYSLDSGLVHTINVNDWDIRFNHYDYTIETNEAKGIRCWVQTNQDNANELLQTDNTSYNPATIDTSGMSSETNNWQEFHNNISLKTLGGSFNRLINIPPKGGAQDFGHSFYAPTYTPAHAIRGYRTFVVQLVNGNYIQVFPEISHSTTQQIIGISNLDGSNNRNIVYDRNLFVDQQWAYYSHSIDSVLPPSFAPAINSFDFVFTKYFDETNSTYDVGALSNINVGLEQLDNIDYHNATFPLNYDTDDAAIIGHDWKTEINPNQYQMVGLRNYLVKTITGNEYLLYFCDFGGTINGNIEFRIIPKAQIESFVNPVADFAMEDSISCINENIYLINTSEDEDLIEWLIPSSTLNGSNSDTLNIAYSSSGYYDVGLIAYKMDGQDTLFADTTYISNYLYIAPSASALFSFNANSQTISFVSNSQFEDSLLFIFGDGHFSSFPNPTHTYGQAGSYNVQLIAYSACVNDTFSLFVQADAPVFPPTANFNHADSVICMGESVEFFSISTDATSFEWTFESGVPAVSTIEHPQILYPNSGNFKVSLIVHNSEGSDTLTISNRIEVLNSPTALFNLIQDTSFISIMDLSSNGDSVKYSFGDGQFSWSQNPTHNYTDTGYFHIIQTIFGRCGQDTDTIQVYIDTKVVKGDLKVEEIKLSKEVYIYPNPVNSAFRVNSDAPILEIEIYTLEGKILKTIANPSSLISMEGLSPGTYILYIKMALTDQTAALRLIKI
jgi:PKD repeat protein